MLKRTITGAVITAVSVGFIFLREFVDVKLFDILIYFMALVATFELTRAFNGKINGFQKIAAFLFTAAIIPIAVFWKKGLWQVYIAYAAVLCFSSLFIKDESLESIGYSLAFNHNKRHVRRAFALRDNSNFYSRFVYRRVRIPCGVAS